MKLWKLFLSSILLTSVAVTFKQTNSNSTFSSYSLSQSRAFYQNVDQEFVDHKADVSKVSAGSNNEYITDRSIVFYWNQYADSWEEFKANYQDLDLRINLNIAFNWYNIKWQTTNLHVPLSKMNSSDSNWISIYQINLTTTQRGRWDNTHGELFYACWYSSKSVSIRFKMLTWASNNYDNYYFTVDTRSVSSKTTYDYQSIESLLNEKVNNQSLVLNSDYSTSLQDERNKPTEKAALDNLMKNALGQYYERWYPYILPYTYNDETNQATISIKFNDPNLKKNILWKFKVVITFNLTQDYWDKAFEERLTITPGQIIDPNNPNGAMIVDQPLQWENKRVYGTTAFIRFDGAPDDSETMKVNGVPIQVINNQFTYQMTDNQEHGTNKYHILLEKHDLNDFNKIIGKFEIDYVVKQNVPNLDLIWYAWNPAKNPDQKHLIEPTLPNGERNPHYDPEVNVKTGTKKQIVWVKHKAQNSFPLDPLDKNGDIITNSEYDEGFLAEGSVSGMGIIQNFNDSWIKSVQRVKVDERTLQPIGKIETINADKDGSRFSLAGTYLYIITDQKGITANKFIIIGQNWKDKYAKFLDVLNNSETAVPFWSTIQGFHLKNYLIKYKLFNSKEIQALSFEEVSSYWKEYVSDVKSQRIDPSIDPGNMIDLNTINLDAIKMNAKEISTIKNNIIRNITQQLDRYNLDYNLDYQILALDIKANQLLNYDSSGNAIVDLTIRAIDTSAKARNQTVVTVRNSTNYDPNKVTDLSKIKFDSYRYDFSKFSSQQLRDWILKAIANKFKSLNLVLAYQIDYHVSSLDDATLKRFISTKEVTNLNIIIKAEVLSDLAVNSTSLILINDCNGEVAPPEPPDPKPDPTPLLPDENNWEIKQRNLIIISVIVASLVVSVTMIVFFKYRLKKGIGVKRTKKLKQ